MQSKLSFYGGAGSVTGSNFLLEADSPSPELGTTKIRILVDCGLFQGAAAERERNWEPFAYNPKEIAALVVTHAHIDHVGRIPRLVAQGFAGKIISTEATKAIVEPLLLDSMELLRRAGERSGKGPLYTKEDIARASKQWEGVPYHQEVSLPGGLSLEFFDAGHIVGSAMAVVSRGGRSIAFTGDLGGGNSPLLPPTEQLPPVEYLVMESVYGDRTREGDENRRERLENVIEDTAARGGTLLIPAFSTERTQDLLFEIRALMLEKRVPALPVYVDSPLARKMTEAFLRYPQYFAPDVAARVASGERIFEFPGMSFTEDAAASRALAASSKPKIVIAGSGMGSGGRVEEHQRTVLPDPHSTLLIVGYQAAGSAGRRLIEGAKTLEIHGERVPVKCKIETLYGYSAHRDGESLLEFVNALQPPPGEVFVVMGEPSSASFLAQRIRDYLGFKATTPEAGQSVTIDL